jgi:RHS repeat-associated protein
VFLNGEQVSGTTRFFTTDHLGTVNEVTDGTVTLLARYAFDSWGRRTITAGADVTTVGFTGHEWHGPSGVWLTHHRAYDPTLGRWSSQDPIGYQDGPNVYSYVRNAPVNNTDPLGLKSEVCCRPLLIRGLGWLKHCYIRVDSDTYGLHREGNIGYKRKNDPSDLGGECKPCEAKCPNGDPRKCIEDQHNKYPSPSRYAITGPNSNTYAGTLANACCKGGMPGGLGPHPGSNDAPAPPAK